MKKGGKSSAKAKKKAPAKVAKTVKKPVKKSAPPKKAAPKKQPARAARPQAKKIAPPAKKPQAPPKNALPAKKPAPAAKPAPGNKTAPAKKAPIKILAPAPKPPKFPEFKGKKKKFYELLMVLREQILGQMKFLSDEALDSQSSGLAGSISNHMADYGSDNFLHDMELEMITNEGEVIEMIDEAIQKLAMGEYGKCIECGCDIPEARLEAKPYARFCLKCKVIHEEKGETSPG